MEQLKSTLEQIRWRIGVWTFILQCMIAGCILWIFWQFSINPIVAFILAVLVLLVGAISTAFITSHIVKRPLRILGEAIVYTTTSSVIKPSAPNLDNITVGQAYVTNLVFQLYELINNQKNDQQVTHREVATQSSTILNHLPLPLFVLNKDELITYGSDEGLNYVGMSSSDVFGKSISDVINMEFSSTFTLGSWLDDCRKNKVTDEIFWRRVRIKQLDNGKVRQCDIAGHYAKDNPEGVEFIIVLFDRTAEYSQDDESLSLMALAVHELRSPLTIMRGYLEALDEEMNDKPLDADSRQSILRLKASTKQLTGFINNILNIARIEKNQLAIHLDDTPWSLILDRVKNDMNLIGHARNKTITFKTEDSLPNVGADRLLIYEVLCNLIENSIKYSGDSSEIQVTTSLTKDGLVEVQVIDNGVGIPANIIPTLFERFHRNHRNKSKISGTGLGLYLAKVIVSAHGGDIWIKSKEGHGTTIGFTILPYKSVAKDKERDKNSGLSRTAHGWIKNHNIYRS